MTVNLDKSLTELEKEDWGKPNYDSHLVTICHHLRKKSLKDFTIEDLRIMIGQNISLNYLIPLAIVKLTENIFSEGDFYPGDLLKSVLDSDNNFWTQNVSYWQTVISLFNSNKHIFESDNSYRQIRKSFETFEKINA